MLYCHNKVLFVHITGVFGVECMEFLVYFLKMVFGIYSGLGILALYGNLNAHVEDFCSFLNGSYVRGI